MKLRSISRLAVLTLFCCLLACPALAETVPAEDAGDHLGDKVTVKMSVKASNYLRDKGICFLNSKRNHRDEGNFTVVIFSDGLEAFAEKGIEDPADHYFGKDVEVTGKVEKYRDQIQIKVEDPDQIEVVD